MIDLPHLQAIFERLKAGHHFSPTDGEIFEALEKSPQGYQEYFGAIGLNLVRHERDFFYLEPEPTDTEPGIMVSKVAVFSFILIDHLATQGRSIDEAIMGDTFHLRDLPHFSLDRYASLMREVQVLDLRQLGSVIDFLKRIGWVQKRDDDEFRFLRPFYRVFTKCIELASLGAKAALTEGLRPCTLEPPEGLA